MKPSDWLLNRRTELGPDLGLAEFQALADKVDAAAAEGEVTETLNLVWWTQALHEFLDAQHDASQLEAKRRAEFEAGVLRRLTELETMAPAARGVVSICPLCLHPIIRDQGHNVGLNGVPQHNQCPK